MTNQHKDPQDILKEGLDEIDDKFSLFPTIGGITHEMLAEEMKSFITTLANRLIESARAEGFKAGEEKGRKETLEWATSLSTMNKPEVVISIIAKYARITSKEK